MKIELDLDFLQSEALTANEYLHMYLVSQERYRDAWISAPLQGCELKGLAHMGYISLNPFDTIQGWDKLPAEPRIFLEEKGISLFKIPVSIYRWEQFKEHYPKIDGSRRLHDSLDKNKKKFENLCSTAGNFEKIMKGLKNEKKAREKAVRKGEFFPNWKAMSTWLNQEHYLTYLEDTEDTFPEERTRGIN